MKMCETLFKKYISNQWSFLSEIMSVTVVNNLLTFIIGLMAGALLNHQWRKGSKYEEKTCQHQNGINQEDSSEINFENKLVLVVRNDLKMGKGKAAAQCCHAAVMAHESSRRTDPQTLSSWKNAGQPKIVVKVDSEEEMMELAHKARNLKILASIVRDAGRTQVATGTKTVLAVGPGPRHLIDQLTGHLKLY